MCLGIPGRVLSFEESPIGMHMGRVEFGGISREVCLAYTPGVRVGDWVIVHAGFAISVLNEDEARQTLEALAELAESADEQGEPLTYTTE